MIRLFKHYIPHAVLLMMILDFLALLGAGELAWNVRAKQIGMDVGPVTGRMAPLLSFALALQLAMISVGVYGVEALQSIRFATARLLTAVSLGVIFLSVMNFILPGSTLWRSNSLYAMAFAIIALLAVRVLLGRLLGGEAFRRRIVVLGAGKRANRILELSNRKTSGFSAVGFIAMSEAPPVVPEAIRRTNIESLADHVVKLGATEVVLALEERRGSLPLADLLRIKTTGVHVNDISSFLERETGRVDLDTVNPSWFIFSDGFTAGRRLSTAAKRMFDIAASLAVLLLTFPLIILFAIIVKLDSPGPAFYRQQRVGLYRQPYNIIKIRSMRQDAEAGGKAIWASKGDPRVTRVGQLIRKLRIDELPQLWCVLKGEMSFVGPRPERPEFVAELEQQIPYYAERHMVKPGLTGWAQINYPYGASIDDARQKLEYDLYYAKNYTLFLDLLILMQTLRVLLWPDGAR